MVFIFIILIVAWFWDSTKEKIDLTEERNDLERVARDAMAVLIGSVGDPPNWNDLTFDADTIYSIGIGKNRAWLIDENKATRLSEDPSYYNTTKRILGIRGPNYEMFLNISKYNGTGMQDISIVGIKPNSSAKNVVRINRFAISDDDNSWVTISMLIWQHCSGVDCY